MAEGEGEKERERSKKVPELCFRQDFIGEKAQDLEPRIFRWSQHESLAVLLTSCGTVYFMDLKGLNEKQWMRMYFANVKAQYRYESSRPCDVVAEGSTRSSWGLRLTVSQDLGPRYDGKYVYIYVCVYLCICIYVYIYFYIRSHLMVI